MSRSIDRDMLDPARRVIQTPFRGAPHISGRPFKKRDIDAFCRWWRGEATQTDIAAELGILQSSVSRLFRRIRREAEE